MYKEAVEKTSLVEALDILSTQADETSPGTTAWISAMHAVESAQLGDTRQALTSWKRAEEAYSVADPEEDRIWTHFLDQTDSIHTTSQQALRPHNRQPAVRGYLEEFATTKRQFPSQR